MSVAVAKATGVRREAGGREVPMPQLHFYVPKEIAEEIKRRAELRGITLSRYVAELVQQEMGGGWPEGWFDQVVGGWTEPS